MMIFELIAIHYEMLKVGGKVEEIILDKVAYYALKKEVELFGADMNLIEAPSPQPKMRLFGIRITKNPWVQADLCCGQFKKKEGE
jgi:hypothetical protein